MIPFNFPSIIIYSFFSLNHWKTKHDLDFPLVDGIGIGKNTTTMCHPTKILNWFERDIAQIKVQINNDKWFKYRAN